MFFLKQKALKITAYTYDEAAFEFAKPTYHTKSPGWFRSIPTTLVRPAPHLGPGFTESTPSAALCPGIKDFIKKGISLPCWYDAEFQFDSGGGFTESNGPRYNYTVSMHANEQLGSFYSDRLFLKMQSPWKFISKEPTDFLYIQNFYGSDFFQKNNVLVPPGLINFKHQASTNVHLFFERQNTPHTVKIPLGTPLVQFFPITEKKVIFETKLIGLQEYNSMCPMPRCSFGVYYRKLKLMNQNG